NTGLNSVNVTVGYKRRWERLSEKKEVPVRMPFKSWRAEVGYMVGFSQNGVYGGPTYGVHSVFAAAGLRRSPYLTWLMGGVYEYNHSRFASAYRDFINREVASRNAKSTSIYLAANLDFAKVTIQLQEGVYVPVFHKRKERLYSQLSI